MPNTTQNIVTRFAPSPTGDLHVGGLRNILYSWLFARQHSGDFLLRIEDTDRARFNEGSEQVIFDALAWLEIDYDREVWRQSERLAIYKKYAAQLVHEGKAYYCSCSKERLEALRKEQEAKKIQPRYDGYCQNKNIEPSKNVTVIRFKVPYTGETVVDDIVRKRVVFDNAVLDDFIITKADGFPTYHLAHIVDDHESGVTHVIRSEEWLSSLPKHYLLHEALGWEKPAYAHLPLVLAADKSKLSKRHGAVSVLQFRDLGYLPNALLNFVLLLGWHPKEGSEKELFTREEMLAQFSLDDVRKSGAIFDYQKLDWMSAEYIKQTNTQKLVQLAHPFLKSYEGLGMDLTAAVELEKSRIKKLSDLTAGLAFLFDNQMYEPELLIWKKSSKQETLQRLTQLMQLLESISEESWDNKTLEEMIKHMIEKGQLGIGDTLWPLRTALSGQKNSPGPFELAAVLGKKKSLQRIQYAIQRLQDR